MIKVRDAGELQRTLDENYSWRVQEMHNVQQIAAKLKGPAYGVALRAAVPIFYAHYEGFIKYAAIAYASFLTNSGLNFSQVKTCMRGVKAMQKVQQLGDITRRFSAAGLILNEIMMIGEEKAAIPLHEYIADVGNLDFEILIQILELLDLNSSYYQGRKALIEETLLFNRNGIAHGDRYPIDKDTFDTLHAEVLNIMRFIKTDIENAVSLKSYLAS